MRNHYKSILKAYVRQRDCVRNDFHYPPIFKRNLSRILTYAKKKISHDIPKLNCSLCVVHLIVVTATFSVAKRETSFHTSSTYVLIMNEK